MVENKSTKLSEDEIALYDRQIRLWGMAAQANMRSAKVLLINVGSIGTEITKNIVLSGIGHLCIMDNHIVTEEDLGSQFFLSREDVGKARIDATKERIVDLNPRVELTFKKDDISVADKSLFKEFDLVIGTELSSADTKKLNSFTRELNIPLYITGSNGMFAYIFVDLIEFSAEDEKIQSMKPTTIGKISANREIIGVQTRVDEEDSKKIYETIITKNMYISFEELLENASLEGKLTKRQMKRVSNVLPLTLTLLSEGQIDEKVFSNAVVKTCEQLRIPSDNISKEYLEQFINQQGIEFSPVAAIVGGAVAQDVINILGKRQSPLNNFIVFDGITLDMPIFEF